MNDVVSLYLPGSVDYADSYGLIACELLKNLSDLGAHVNMFAMGQRFHENQTADVAALVRKPIQPTLGGILLGWPSTYAGHNGLAHVGPRIGVTMFESSRIPPHWVEPLNKLDAIITPTKFSADIFKTCGVTTPIHIVPLGIGDIYQPVERPKDRPLTFLCFLDRGKRKGGLAAQEAFSLAFGDSTDVHLILKMRKPKVVVNIMNENMTLIQQDYTEAQLYDLYKQADVLINPNMGEGFGLIPREAAATGCISLTTNWGGTAGDLDKWGWPLPYKLIKAEWGHPVFEGLDLGMWATPNIEGIADTLKHVAAHREWFSAIAQSRAADVRKLYSWRRFAEQVLEIWKEVADGKRVRQAA